MEPVNPDCHQCKDHGLNLPDGHRACQQHIPSQWRSTLDDLDHRAQRVIPDGWPYGPNIDVQARIDLIRWAESLGVKHSGTRCQQLHWLRSGQCQEADCRPLGGWTTPPGGRATASPRCSSRSPMAALKLFVKASAGSWRTTRSMWRWSRAGTGMERRGSSSGVPMSGKVSKRTDTRRPGTHYMVPGLTAGCSTAPETWSLSLRGRCREA